MAFDSFTFIFIFSPLSFLLFSFSPLKLRPYIILLVSFLFYLWGSPYGLFILCTSMIVDFVLVRLMQSSKMRNRKKQLLVLLICLNVSILFYFKYFNFFVSELNSTLTFYSLSPCGWQNTIFPLGISFIIFHKISYAVDAYQSEIAPTESFLNYAIYLTIFPKLLQGPITRYRDLATQLKSPKSNIDDIFDGIYRFTIGLAKKVLVANVLGVTVDKVFRLELSSLSPGYAWLGAVCYTFQIYFDFSGYVDMAIGIGKIIGFSFPENFNRPYLSGSFTEFWRRWHITLSQWLKEYIYIPLGGNRCSRLRNYLNLWTVFLISGLWHGANWTFILWGLYHGSFIVLDKFGWLSTSQKLSKIVTVPFNFFLIMIGWVLFRSANIVNAYDYIMTMFNIHNIFKPSENTLLIDLINNRGVFVLFVAALISFFPESLIRAIIARFRNVVIGPRLLLIRICIVSGLLLLSLMAMTHSAFMPFIYKTF